MSPWYFAGLLGLWALSCAQAEPVEESPTDSGVNDGALGGSGGSADGGGTGGKDAGPDVIPIAACQCGDPACGDCPTPKNVPSGGYAVYAMEVTNETYASWLATLPNPKAQVGACAWNTSYVPAADWPATDLTLPVTSVDFCDAQAYCRWARRRLCGKIGGGPNGYSDFADATKSQWFNACSVGGTRDFPYGSTYNGLTCNGADYGKGVALAPGSAKSCEGGYPELFDMSGNVWEWEDSCDAATGENDNCRIRGGSFSQGSTALGCAADSSLARNTTAKSIGFRCCE